MSMMTHYLDASSCQQLNLSSECPWWLTPWMQVHRSMSAIGFRALNSYGDSLPGCKFTGACQQLNLSSECPWWLTPWMQVYRSMSAIEFELWISIVTHCLNASSQEHVSNWIWALNVHGDSLPGCKFTGACQQLNLSSECPQWLTGWMQVYSSMSAIEFAFWMSMVTHSLDVSSQKHVSNCIWALNVHGGSLPGCQFTGACQQLNLTNVHGDSLSGCKFTGACQELNLSSEYP